MDIHTVVARTHRGLKVKLLAKLALLLLVLAWFVYPQATIWQHAGQGLSAAGAMLRSATIRMLGGSTETQQVVSSDINLGHVKGIAGFPATEVRCLALAIYFETGNEPREAQIGVGQIALNRARTAKTPKAVCKTIYNGLTQGGACLFEATCRALGTPPQHGPALEAAIEVAQGLATGAATMPLFAEATHFHERRARPAWRGTLFKLASHGRIEFYTDNQPENPALQPRPGDGDDSARNAASARRPVSPRGDGQSKSAGQRQGDGGALSRQVFGID